MNNFNCSCNQVRENSLIIKAAKKRSNLIRANVYKKLIQMEFFLIIMKFLLIAQNDFHQNEEMEAHSSIY